MPYHRAVFSLRKKKTCKCAGSARGAPIAAYRSNVEESQPQLMGVQVQQYGSPYDPYTSCSPRLQSTAYTSTSATGAGNATANAGGGLHQEATTVYVAGDALPPLASSSSTPSLSTTTASYTRYEVVPSSYATTHAIRSSSSSSKVLTVDLPSPDSGIGADAVTPRQDHHPTTALHQVSLSSAINFISPIVRRVLNSRAASSFRSGSLIHRQRGFSNVR